MAKGKILLVDDDLATRESLSRWLESEGHQPGACAGGAEALASLDGERWELVLVDLQLPGMDGIMLLSRIRALHPEIPVVMMTADPAVDTATRALKAGARDYLTKPLDRVHLAQIIARLLEQSRAQREMERLRHNLREVSTPTDLVGRSPTMKRVREQVETVGPTDAPVLITGERGTGKEVVARAIHARSPRNQFSMAVLRCGSLTEELIEEELFGVERPPGSTEPRKKGKFEIADGGTVLLDEISEISPKVQTDLLDVIETGEMVRVGGSRPVKVDFRWIAATNHSLESLVREHSFRTELYFRLNVFSIELPPLRERREDIPALVDHFLEKHAAAMNRSVPAISRKAMDLLLSYHWPGNVRELENSVERALLISRDKEVLPAHFPFQIQKSAREGSQSLREVERRHIVQVIEQCGWNLSKSARILGIDRTTLYNKLRKYGLR